MQGSIADLRVHLVYIFEELFFLLVVKPCPILQQHVRFRASVVLLQPSFKPDFLIMYNRNGSSKA